MCRLRRRVLSGETEGEARAAARARHLGEKRCGGVFTLMVGTEGWRGVSACTKKRRGCCVQAEAEGVGGRD